ncbi:hypothetical protein [Streptomyces millisiae]|uniref:Uncharacterized protein n=1 Tax=Streptomyces millisiae TaxID=3075542 RepID=A0ABU2LMI6_9ACTN|nr:hypothetical protein [Streptomyces sp. DSM 44918]MDT0318283.1 hypothetical protein [Streptomyces sp. DSM 44918]
MDQGLAAIMGASMGAFATGIGAYISGLYANKIEKKRARREVYRAFIAELIAIRAQITALRGLIFTPLDGRDADAIRAGLTELAPAPSRLRLLELGVRLEGPDSLSSLAEAATDRVSWLEERLNLTFEQNEFTNMRETVTSDCDALDRLMKDIGEEAPKHL